MGDLKVGTSSWADRLLLASGWYPRAVNTPAGRLAYYAERFDLVEVDTTYYALPAEQTCAAWAARTPASFTFDVKAFSLLTGHPTRAAALPADLRPESTRDQLRRHNLAPGAYDEIWDRFRAAVAPIANAGKLGVVLLQFPPWLSYGEAAKRRIAETAERCQPFRAAVELRHRSWFDGDNALDTLIFLQRHDISFVCVDMPQGYESSVPPILAVTAEPAVVRFHGHSPDWAGGDKQEKFRYAYPEAELTLWANRLREFAGEAARLHVLMNNCCGDQAQRDAARLAELLGTGPGAATGAEAPPVAAPRR